MSRYDSLPITQLPPGTILSGDDVFPVVDIDDLTESPSGTTYKYTITQLLTFLQTQPAQSWTTISGGSQAAVVNSGYVVGNAAQTTITLPAICAVGDSIDVIGLGAGGWVAQANTGQVIQFGAVASSSGGTWTTTNANDSATFTCRVANTNFIMISNDTFTST